MEKLPGQPYPLLQEDRVIRTSADANKSVLLILFFIKNSFDLHKNNKLRNKTAPGPVYSQTQMDEDTFYFDWRSGDA